MNKKSPFQFARRWQRSVVIFGCLATVLGLFFYILYSSADSLVDEISQEDRQAIEPLLKDLVFDNQFGYVLIDEKPVAIAGYLSPEPFINLLFLRKSHAFNFTHSWEVLEKYRSKLNSGNFLLLKEKSSSHANDPQLKDVDIYIVAIINKRLFLKTVEEHLDLFKSVLGSEVTPTNLLAHISEGKSSLYEAVHCNEGLYGILLGYGKTNAFAFKRNLELAYMVDPLFRDLTLPFTLCCPKPSASFQSLEEEYMHSKGDISYFDLSFPLSSFMPPAFVILNDPSNRETLVLKKKYRQAHRRLVKMYSKQDFLCVTLEQLCR